MEAETPKEIQNLGKEIMHEVNTSIAILGGGTGLLSVVGSYKSTLTDMEVLTALKKWNSATLEQMRKKAISLLEYSNR